MENSLLRSKGSITLGIPQAKLVSPNFTRDYIGSF